MNALFLNVGTANGSCSINLNQITLVRWGVNPAGEMKAKLWFVGDDEALELEGEPAADLSGALSAIEAATERTQDRAFTPALYRDESDEDVLADLEASMLSGPPYVA